MNLENLNLVELSAQEVQEVEGGIWPIVFAAACLIADAAVMYHVSHCKECGGAN